MQQRIRHRSHECWAATNRYWDTLHVERHGKYSVERLYCFEQHSERATYICWLLSLLVLDNCRHFVVRLPVTLTQVVPVASCVSVQTVATMFAMANVVGFPIPFFPVLVAPGWAFGITVGVLTVWGKYFRETPELKCELAHYVRIVMALVSITLVYLPYIFLFQKLSGYPQVAFALVLPQIKLVFKNVLNHLLKDLEDAKPELIILNAEVFHALYVVCCMQNATSYHTTAVLIAMDFGFAILSLRRIFAVVREFEVEVFEELSNMREDEAGV